MRAMAAQAELSVHLAGALLAHKRSIEACQSQHSMHASLEFKAKDQAIQSAG